MAVTYEPIATTTTTAVTQITFSSISSAYTDIVIILSLRASGGDNLAIRFNNDAATNYSVTRLTANGATVASNRASNSSYPVLTNGTYPVGSATTYKIDIFNYSGTNTNKSFLSNASMNVNGTGETTYCVGLWRSTSAINRIDLFGSFAANTVATIYGIKAA